MAKGYVVTFYQSVSDPNALAEYAKLAGPAVQSCGGRFLARAEASAVYEKGLKQRTVIIEFDSVEKAKAFRASAEYGVAMKAFGTAAERDVRIVEGV